MAIQKMNMTHVISYTPFGWVLTNFPRRGFNAMKWFLTAIILLSACEGSGGIVNNDGNGGGADAGSDSSGRDANSGDTGTDTQVQLCETDAAVDDVAQPEPRPPAPASRILRRIHLSLRGQPPGNDDVKAIIAADAATQTTLLDAAIDDALASPDFYLQMVDFGHQWMRNGRAINGTTGDAYQGNESSHLYQCAADSQQPNAYYKAAYGGVAQAPFCDDPNAPSRSIQPWWDRDTTHTFIGDAASTATTGMTFGGDALECGIGVEIYYDFGTVLGCGCGPSAMWCYPSNGLAMSNDTAGSQRRDIWDEPARLVGHLAWHDVPLTDVILGNYTVATTRLAAWYLRFGRQTGLYNAQLDANTDWFRRDSELGDPIHAANDPNAWKELVVEDVAPQLLSLSNGAKSADPSRTLEWNPVDDSGPAPGLPAAGVFTMPGPNSTFPRERVRAARFIEIFACREFNPPPPEIHFPPTSKDIASSGQCMHCHVLMDPVAMAFRRWIFQGYYVPRPRLADLENLQVPQDLFDPAQEYTHRAWFGSGAERWKNEWVDDTVMTPVERSTLDLRTGALFYDTIPPEYSIFGENTDGTMGPLGFAKVLVSSGEFDQCAVRRLHERFVGRELNPETEGRYIDELAKDFRDGNRVVRPFIRKLLQSDDFKRGW